MTSVSSFSSSRFRPTIAVVNLGRIAENFRILRKTVAQGAFVCPMVKANAYGHGDVAVAARLRSEGAENLGVALIEEGLKLRQNGDLGRILQFGMFDASSAEIMLENHITPVLSSRDALEFVVQSRNRSMAKMNGAKPIEVHLELNSGMNRLGIPLSEVSTIATRLFELTRKGQIKLGGLCTHLAVGEDFEIGGGHSAEQLRRFRQAEDALRKVGLDGFHVHIANSSATAAIGKLKSRDSSYENLGIRPGIALYGVEPDNAVGNTLGVQPALKFLSQIALIQDVPKGEGVSYGLRWRAPRDSRIGVIPCGYADGYRRLFSGGHSNSEATTFVIVRGKRVPVVGTVCMDYFMCDLTEVELAVTGDLVTLLGASEGVSVTVNELATRAQTIPYEIFTGISERVPRLYVDDEASDRYS